jgi:hypothetical protein
MHSTPLRRWTVRRNSRLILVGMAVYAAIPLVLLTSARVPGLALLYAYVLLRPRRLAGFLRWSLGVEPDRTSAARSAAAPAPAGSTGSPVRRSRTGR